MSRADPTPTHDFLYGLNPVFEAIRAGRRSLFTAYLNKSASRNPRLAKLAALLEKKNVHIQWVEKGRLIHLSGTRDHQGVVLRCSLYPYVPFGELLDAQRLLLLDNIEDPHNVGAILRSAEVFGFSSVLLPKRGVPDVYPSVVKVSAGATEFLRIAKELSANGYVKKAADQGFHIVALDAKGEIDIANLQLPPEKRLLLVIGGEDKSVGQFILNAADCIVRIDQRGKIGSLNSSVAAGVAMFTLS